MEKQRTRLMWCEKYRKIRDCRPKGVPGGIIELKIVSEWSKLCYMTMTRILRYEIQIVKLVLSSNSERKNRYLQ